MARLLGRLAVALAAVILASPPVVLYVVRGVSPWTVLPAGLVAAAAAALAVLLWIDILSGRGQQHRVRATIVVTVLMTGALSWTALVGFVGRLQPVLVGLVPSVALAHIANAYVDLGAPWWAAWVSGGVAVVGCALLWRAGFEQGRRRRHGIGLSVLLIVAGSVVLASEVHPVPYDPNAGIAGAFRVQVVKDDVVQARPFIDLPVGEPTTFTLRIEDNLSWHRGWPEGSSIALSGRALVVEPSEFELPTGRTEHFVALTVTAFPERELHDERTALDIVLDDGRLPRNGGLIVTIIDPQATSLYGWFTLAALVPIAAHLVARRAARGD